MWRTLLCVFLLFAFCSFAVGQGGVLMGPGNLPPITNSLGQPIPGATVNVFTATASGNPPVFTCVTPVTVYADVNLNTPITTLTTDNNGNLAFFISPSSNPYGYTISGQNTNTTQCYGFSAMVAPGSSPSFQTVTAEVLDGVCYVGSGGGSPKYANLAAAVADSNCTTIFIGAKSGCYTETWSSALSAHGTLAIVAQGCVAINQNGNHPLNLTGGGTAADNFTLQSFFPWSDHGNGSNSGFQFSGYTGTGCAICIGNSGGSNSRTANLKIAGVDVSLISAGSGAVGINLLNTQNFHLDNVFVGLGATNQIAIQMDGSSFFTGIGDIHLPIVEGSANGQVAIRAKGGTGGGVVTAVNITNGQIVLSGSSTVCIDANQADLFLSYPDCNTAATAITTEGASARVGGDLRIDSGVTQVATFASGAGVSSFKCWGCLFPPDGGTTLTNSSGNDQSVRTGIQDLISGEVWAWRCTGHAGVCELRDMANSKTPIVVNPNGNIFFGNGASQFIVGGSSFISPAGNNFEGAEGAAATCSANNDFLWGDSTDHRWKMCNNNGAATDVAGLGDFASPPAIGNTTANTGKFSTLQVGSGQVFSGSTGSGSNVVSDNAPSITGIATVGGIKLSGSAPTCTFTSGNGGTGNSCVINTGSTNTGGLIQATTGSGAQSSTGVITLTFANSPYGTNTPGCVFTLNDGATAWNSQAVVHAGNSGAGATTSSAPLTWSNNGANLVASSQYQINWVCPAK